MKNTALRIFATILLFALPVSAKKAPETAAQFAPDHEITTVRDGNVRIDVSTGLPTAVYHVNYRLTHNVPEEMASQYLRAHHEMFGLRADLSDLRVHAVRASRAGTTVRFRQVHEGLLVHQGEIAVSYNHDEVVVYVAASLRPVRFAEGVAFDLTPTETPEAARDHAYDLLGVSVAAAESAELVVAVLDGEPRLVHRVRVTPSIGPSGDWQVLRDARSGEVLQIVDRAYYGAENGQGPAFDPDPLSSAGATYGDTGFVDGGDAATPQLDGETFTRNLLDLTFAGGNYSLAGPYAEIVDLEGPFNGLYSQASSTWSGDRSDDLFEATNTYYHIDTYMRYINETLGIAVSPYQYNGGVRFDPHGLNGSDNSFYSSGTGAVVFGEGGVDDAEDADVVIHELGHGLHDWFTVGGLSQVNGLSEGFGDYVAQSYSRAFGHWTPADPAYHWVFVWDGHNPFWNGRITNYGASYPGGLINQIHTDGQIWSTCNMLIWDAIGRTKIDSAMFEGLRMTGSSTNQEDAAQATLQAAGDLGYSSGDLSTMESIYRGCGYDVTAPQSSVFFSDGFESGDFSAWSSSP